MTDEITNTDQVFLDVLEGNPAIAAKWDAITESVIATAAESGATITREDCMRVPSARISAMTSEGLDTGEVERQLLNLPAVKEAHRARALRQEIEDGNAASIAAVYALPKSERMEWARKQGAMRGTDKDHPFEKLTPDQEKQLVQTIGSFPPSARMNIARRYNLT